MSGKGARQRHVAGASSSASENSEVSTSTAAPPAKPSKPAKAAGSDNNNNKTAKAAAATTSDSSAATTTNAAVEREARPEDTQRALRFIIMLSVAILVVPVATFFGVQAAFGVGNQFSAFAAVSAVNLIMLYTVCYAPKYAS